MKPYIERASVAGLEWVKSSYSGNNGNCIEVATLHDGGRALRDSKYPDGPALAFTAAEFNAFVLGVMGGEFRQV
ncbi:MULTISPECIES: DUF397 domain-containing protein [unclassified Streptomyces]|uniref:DUF397 domain-containing protein n=1 Tax=unclassified Streptomyces TaxID=2593676 RepID=UPI0001C1BFF7|nr:MULTISPECIES: DUF397 domain-containing protein [unclassified Streptomyces]MYR66655.1 DUF397 domain-containing protein [Streptomyces sp. SID4939]MYS03206.1 DUF397 domain-containing protein [Streptomyces sp. SID4940]MYT66901.1 DUF397 domain-containing protein [Streptomyces sp. SID8357]MYT88322.1 DUF397 domain-containing protein [Streptomyces sp. SID8360]MYU33237.1 DUF397 domain-containing protein [Streptomyces sp. SID8358]MYW39513.1 DUF397 domain-containing protein [Streptomyces sp. SID1]